MVASEFTSALLADCFKVAAIESSEINVNCLCVQCAIRGGHCYSGSDRYAFLQKLERYFNVNGFHSYGSFLFGGVTKDRRRKSDDASPEH